jgi:Tol biopolymer transport system component
MKKSISLSVILIVLICVIAYTLSETTESSKYFERSGDVVKVIGEDEQVTIYTTKKDHINSYLLRVSPDNKYISVVEMTRGYYPPGAIDYEILPKNNLVIIDTVGDVLHSIDDDVRALSWSPDGTKLAYITGTYYEGGVGFRTTGVYILNVESGEKFKIEMDFDYKEIDGYVGGGINLNWAKHDGKLYIQEFNYISKNYVYNPETGKTTEVPYKGIHFSPDGKYYLAIISAERYLYETETNTEITQDVLPIIGTLPFSWLPEKKHHLMSARPISSSKIDKTKKNGGIPQIVRIKTPQDHRIIIFDVDKRKIEKEWIEKR